MRPFAARVWWFIKSRLVPWTIRPASIQPEPASGSQKLFLERRFEGRKSATRSCQLGYMQPGRHNDAVFEQYSGVTVNESKSGLLLLLGSAPPKGKLLEVHTEGTGLRPSFSLVEVRWSKPVRRTSDGDLYLVGCRMSFGPYSYWAF
jgi:hypothetical protein